jgi:uncharacterized protein YjdB
MNVKKIVSLSIAVAIISVTAATPGSLSAKADSLPSNVGISYQVYGQSYAWSQSAKSDGAEAGTEGQSKRVEALKINLTGSGLPSGASVVYQVNQQTYGWSSSAVKSDGAVSGVIGQSKRVEALRATLKNMPGYELIYRVNQQTFGWSPWQTTVSDTDISQANVAGITGISKEVEAIEIYLIKISDAPIVLLLSDANATTTAGKAPTLPPTVIATMSDGSKKDVAVTWNAIPSSNYKVTGKFTVNGTVSESSTKANATVTVEKYSVVTNFDAEISSWLAALPASATTEDKELCLHDHVCAILTYDYTFEHAGLTDSLTTGTATCSGYCAVFAYALEKAKIEVVDVDCWVNDGAGCDGVNFTGAHAMVAVKLDDNNWYYVDPTWDDGDDILTHNYFNFTLNDSIVKEHRILMYSFDPEVDGGIYDSYNS